MGLAARTVRQFVTALASRAPAPGGGAAAALSSALGAALLAKVGRIVLARRGGATRKVLRQACAVCDRERRALVRLMEEDARAYARLVDALRTTRDSPLRGQSLKAARRRALEVPLAICERTMVVLRQAPVLQAAVGRHLVSDVVAGSALLTSGFSAAAATVSANLDGLAQPAQAAAIRRKLQAFIRP